MPGCVRLSLHACEPACILACLSACLPACVPACQHACLPACMHACVRASLPGKRARACPLILGPTGTASKQPLRPFQLPFLVNLVHAHAHAHARMQAHEHAARKTRACKHENCHARPHARSYWTMFSGCSWHQRTSWKAFLRNISMKSLPGSPKSVRNVDMTMLMPKTLAWRHHKCQRKKNDYIQS